MPDGGSNVTQKDADVIANNSQGPGPISQSTVITTNEAGEKIIHTVEYFQLIVCNTIVISDGRCLSKLT